MFGARLRLLCNASRLRRRNLYAAPENSCTPESNTLIAVLPNFARACGRVSVGRYPDKRPDSRQGTRKPRVSRCKSQGQHLSPGMPMKVTLILATVTGSRRRTGAPRSQRGTRLKATTDRAFLVSAGFPSASANTEEACPSLPGVRAGSLPTNPRQHLRSELLALPRLHRATVSPEALNRHRFLNVTPLPGRLGECYD
jgi:hypothetical protein